MTKQVKYRTPNGDNATAIVHEDTKFIVLKKLQMAWGIAWLKHTLASSLAEATLVDKEQGEFVIISV